MSEKQYDSAPPSEIVSDIGPSATEQSNAEELVSIVSHDLQSPLNVARIHLEQAQEEHGSPHLDSVAQSLDRMEALIADFLSLTWDGQRIEQLEHVNLALMANACWQSIDAENASLVVDTTRTIRADTARFQQLLENLFGNAVEHASATTVTVGGVGDDGFYVEDDGVGIPKSERGDVLDSGYSTDDSTGFGLAIVDTIAEAHGWSTTVTESDSGGARFEFRDDTRDERSPPS